MVTLYYLLINAIKQWTILTNDEMINNNVWYIYS